MNELASCGCDWLFSGSTGLGLMAFSLDWATASAILSSPLSTPWPTIVNVFVGFLVAAYIITPLLYWGDFFHAQRFPITTNKLLLSNGQRYNVSEVRPKKKSPKTPKPKIIITIIPPIEFGLYAKPYAN
jgi:hypothetical protein